MNDIAGRGPGGQPAAVLAQPDRNGTGETLPPAQAAAAELFTAISAIRRTARRAARRAWARQPLPPAQSELLRLAAARPGLTVAEAAEELRVAPNTISTLVGRLAEAGLMNREKSAHDGRTVQLTATGKAQQRLAEFRDLRAELAGEAFTRLPAQDQQALLSAVPALLRLSDEMEHL